MFKPNIFFFSKYADQSFWHSLCKTKSWQFYSVMRKASPNVTGSKNVFFFRKVGARLVFYSLRCHDSLVGIFGMFSSFSKCFQFFEVETRAFKNFTSFRYRITMPDRVIIPLRSWIKQALKKNRKLWKSTPRAVPHKMFSPANLSWLGDFEEILSSFGFLHFEERLFWEFFLIMYENY